MESYQLEAVKHIVFSDEADLILHSDPKHLYHVSSKAISSASPVFRAMLGPSFAEGQILKFTAGSLPNFELPDDSTQALRWLFSILHDSHHEFLDDLNEVKPLVQLAILADKYDCVTAVGAYTSSVLARLDIEKQASSPIDDLDAYEAKLASNQEHNSDLIKAVWLLDDAENFQRYTHAHLRAGVEFQEQDDFLDGADGLLIFSTRLDVREYDCTNYLFDEIAHVTRFIAAFMVRAHGYNESDETWEECNYECDFDQRIASRYLEVFGKAGLWPKSPSTPAGLPELLEKIEGLPGPDLRGLKPCKLTRCHASWIRGQVDPEIEELKVRARNIWTGLCLGCFKKDKLGKVGKKCRVPHGRVSLMRDQSTAAKLLRTKRLG